MKKNIIDYKEAQRLKQELETLGINREFIQQKGTENLYSANRIVEGYDFGREITQKEKRALIQEILSPFVLDKKGLCLTRLIQRLQQIGLNEQELYGAIINLGVNGRILEKSGYSYTELLGNKHNACQTIGEYKDKIEKRVSSMTIFAALSYSLNEQEEKVLIEELEALGISREFIKSRDLSNLYTAQTVVESYDFGRKLTSDEKRALIQAILDNTLLNAKRAIYLPKIMQRFEQIGLGEQDIYGTIINLGVNGRVIEETGYAYTDILTNKNNACQTIERYKDKIETRVTSMTILTALGKTLNQQEAKDLQEELETLGISRELIKSREVANLYIAKKIVEDYDFEREITQDEKRALIHAILNNSVLNRNYSKRALSRLINVFEHNGLSTQEIYGAIINLGVKGKVLDKVSGFSYSSLLQNEGNSCQEIAKYRELLETTVAEDTIQRAIKKAERVMQRALKRQKNKGTIEDHEETRNELEGLSRREKLQELAKKQDTNEEISAT